MSTLPYNFESFLIKNFQVSDKTLRNYRADLANFLTWAKSYLTLKGISVASDNHIVPHFSSFLIKEYVHSQTTLRVPPATINRRLSTLRAFGKYLVWAGYLKDNPATSLTNLSNPKAEVSNWSQVSSGLLNEFETYLRLEGVSRTTIKNYMSDARQFLQHLGEAYPASSESPLEKATAEVIDRYKEYLNSAKSALTLKRASSSLKKFFAWAQKAGHIANNPLRVIIETPALPVIPTIPVLEPTPIQAPEPAKVPVFVPKPVQSVQTSKSKRNVVIVASIFSTLSVLLTIVCLFIILRQPEEKPAKTTTKAQTSKVTVTNASVLGTSSIKQTRYPLPAPGITFGDLLEK